MPFLLLVFSSFGVYLSAFLGATPRQHLSLSPEDPTACLPSLQLSPFFTPYLTMFRSRFRDTRLGLFEGKGKLTEDR